MRYWGVWAEGYAATCEHGTATFLGSATAETFNEACDQVMAVYPDQTMRRLFVPGTDSEPPRVWGCRLFPTESQARRSYG